MISQPRQHSLVMRTSTTSSSKGVPTCVCSNAQSDSLPRSSSARSRWLSARSLSMSALMHLLVVHRISDRVHALFSGLLSVRQQLLTIRLNLRHGTFYQLSTAANAASEPLRFFTRCCRACVRRPTLIPVPLAGRWQRHWPALSRAPRLGRESHARDACRRPSHRLRRGRHRRARGRRRHQRAAPNRAPGVRHTAQIPT